MRKPITIDMIKSAPLTITLAGEAVERNRLPLTNPPAPRSFDWNNMAEWQMRAVESAVLDKNPTYVWGAAGTGKDYLGEALAYILNRPLVALSIKPDSDPNEWVGGTELYVEAGATASRPSTGFLAEAVSPSAPVAPVVLLSDFDRARSNAVEVFRQAFEGDPRRRYLTHPTTGAMIGVHPDTIFLLTGNTACDGDNGSGMIASALDASIRNRLTSVRAELPTEAQECAMLASAYPQADAALTALVVKVLRALRAAVVESGLPAAVSLRTAHQFIKTAARRHAQGASHAEAVWQASRLFLDNFAEEGNRALLKGAMDPFIGCGTKP